MRVRVHAADLWGCGHYRLIWPAEALQNEGYDVTILRPGEESQMAGVAVGEKLTDVLLTADSDVDVYVFQRPTNFVLTDLIRILREKGKTVVVDMDDDLACIHPKNAAFQMLHPKYSPRNNWEHARQACRNASLVTCSTPHLLGRYGAASNNRVLRNCIPRSFLDVPRAEDVEPVWGWAGALHSHPDDLPIIGAAVKELDRRGHEFRIIGYTDGTGRALGLPEDPKGTGRVPFENWAIALSGLHVGVAPLANSKFNRSKSWLKPLEYAAVGVPWVGSDRGEYGELQRIGGGFLVGDRTRDWVQVVHRLMTDDDLWSETSEAVRDVAAQCTIEEHAWRWMETWQAAYDLDHGRKPAVVID